MKHAFLKMPLLFTAILLASNILAQKPYAVDQVKQDSLKNIDFLSLNYQYIDKNYQVVIDSATFQKACITHSLPAHTMETYTDSVAVAMMLEFNDWKYANKGIAKVGFTWQKQSFYMWKSIEETKAFAAAFGLNHPYKLKVLLGDESNNDPRVIKFLEELKTKLKNNNIPDFDESARVKFLSYAYRYNPDRIALSDKKRAEKKRLTTLYKERHGKVDRFKIGEGCDEENCCQK